MGPTVCTKTSVYTSSFRDNLSVPSLRVKLSPLVAGTDRMFQNIVNYQPTLRCTPGERGSEITRDLFESPICTSATLNICVLSRGRHTQPATQHRPLLCTNRHHGKSRIRKQSRASHLVKLCVYTSCCRSRRCRSAMCDRPSVRDPLPEHKASTHTYLSVFTTLPEHKASTHTHTHTHTHLSVFTTLPERKASTNIARPINVFQITHSTRASEGHSGMTPCSFFFTRRRFGRNITEYTQV